MFIKCTGGREYLTDGKPYFVTSHEDGDNTIESDEGNLIVLRHDYLNDNCAHLGGGVWEKVITGLTPDPLNLNNCLTQWAPPNHLVGVLSDGAQIGFLGVGFIPCIVYGQEQMHINDSMHFIGSDMNSFLEKYGRIVSDLALFSTTVEAFLAYKEAYDVSASQVERGQ